MNYFTSDQHFGHINVIEYCNRPFQSLEQMHAGLIKNWNQTVREEDVVYVLGDFSFLNITLTTEILRDLKGHKILIWGNHDDRKRNRLMKAGFSAVLEQGVVRLSKEVTVKLCHFPFAPSRFEQWWKGFDARYMHKRPVAEKGMWLLHGHVHNIWKIKPKKKMINVGVDQWDFTPVSDNQIINIISKSTK